VSTDSEGKNLLHEEGISRFLLQRGISTASKKIWRADRYKWPKIPTFVSLFELAFQSLTILIGNAAGR
jgi:hypothetical protein